MHSIYEGEIKSSDNGKTESFNPVDVNFDQDQSGFNILANKKLKVSELKMYELLGFYHSVDLAEHIVDNKTNVCSLNLTKPGWKS